jgi:hypothetical protein
MDRKDLTVNELERPRKQKITYIAHWIAGRLKTQRHIISHMQESFTPDEELVILFLKKHAKSTAAEIAKHTGLRQRGVLRRAFDCLDAKGVLRHTDDRVERYYLVHSG